MGIEYVSRTKECIELEVVGWIGNKSNGLLDLLSSQLNGQLFSK